MIVTEITEYLTKGRISYYTCFIKPHLDHSGLICDQGYNLSFH